MRSRYPNTGSGFGASVTWPTPPEVRASLTSKYNCTPQAYSTLDLTADAKPDLVATSDCDDATPFGTSEWHVYDAQGR